jgi:hypothetical protein
MIQEKSVLELSQEELGLISGGMSWWTDYQDVLIDKCTNKSESWLSQGLSCLVLKDLLIIQMIVK